MDLVDKSVTIVIPSYNCTKKFFSVVQSLRKNNINNKILIIDDNSNTRSRLIIQNIKNIYKNIKIHKNVKNKGQGGSIKTSYGILKQKTKKICTMDDDGQHHTKDIKNLLKNATMQKNNNFIIYGSREMHFKDTPLSSYLGNHISKKIFSILTNKKIIDTQTGLRIYPVYLGIKFLKIKADGFDFHNLMNYFIVKNNIKIKEIKIKTIYFNKNKSTRFESLKDTIKILKSIRKFYISFFFSNQNKT